MTIGGSGLNVQTQDTAAARQDLFNKLDQDGDGKVTKDELKTALANRPGASGAGAGNGPSLDDLFNRIDTNGDGSIDQSENNTFLDSVKKQHRHGPPDPAQMAKHLFEKADGDGDGKLTKAELAAALPKHGGASSTGASSSSSSSSSSALDDLFNDADTDGDGAITQSELQAGLEKRLQRFTSYDQNGGITTSAAGSSQTLGVA